MAGDYLYGTTSSGGLSSGGMIFKIKPDGSDYTNVFEFVTESGYSSWSSLLYEGSFLYGITAGGGSNNDNGTIFKFDDALPLSVPGFSEPPKISLFPNPVRDVLNINLPENKETEIILYTPNGQLIIKKTINNNATIDLKSLKSGIYILQIENRTYKIIKE